MPSKYKGYWLGKKRDKETNKKISKKLKGRIIPLETIEKMKGRTDEKNPWWKGDNISVIGIHQWLRRKFKKKMVCEKCGKIGSSPMSIQWAKIPGKDYERKRENFIELCSLCHVRMDTEQRMNTPNFKSSYKYKYVKVGS